MKTSHRVSHALFFILSLVGVVNGVRAQQASTDSPSAAQSEQPKPQADKAQQAKAATAGDHSSTSSPQTAASSSAKLQNIGPSADILRSARNAGFKIKKTNGTVGFCKSEAPVGTHFVSESCIGEQQLSLLLERAQGQRDGLQHMVGPPEVTR
jgi:hypothetical protein